MAKETEIAWTDSTFNPWWGCTKINPACDNCYASALDKRTGGAHWGAGVERRRTSAKNWNDPVRWNKNADAFFAEHGRRQRVFCASMADVFDNEVPSSWRADLFQLIIDTPNLNWLLLTKRIGNASAMINDAIGDIMQSNLIPLPNVWLGITICNQSEADRDIPKLLAVPAAKRFLSIEPLLGPVDLSGNLPAERTLRWYRPMLPMLDWVIVGGESGQNARPMHPDFARKLRDQCLSANVPFLFKQFGEWAPYHAVASGDENGYIKQDHVRYLVEDGRESDGHFRKGDAAVVRVGKKAAGRILDGVLYDMFPI